MAGRHEIHCYEYVNRPYDAVSRALVADAAGLLQRATMGAADRAERLLAQLKVSVAGIRIGKEVRIEVGLVDTAGHAPRTPVLPATRIDLAWRAADHASLFPAMRAQLVAYPLGSEETQLELAGVYTPPGSLLGEAADYLVGHRIADASIHRLLDELVERLRADLPAPPPSVVAHRSV